MSAADATEHDPAFRLIYRSHSLVPVEDRRAVHGDIFRVARSDNTRRGITGALLIYDDWFCQTLEGEEESVRALLARIERDPRHEKIEVLYARAASRVFSRWAMAMVAEHGEADIPLIANTKGITPAGARRTTAGQEAVLDLMREATRGFGRAY
jgi:predicted sulfurtransferase